MTEDGGANTNGCEVAPAHALNLQDDAANFAFSVAVGDAALALTGGAQVLRQARTELRAEAKKAVPAT
jgi:hypothetical protein